MVASAERMSLGNRFPQKFLLLGILEWMIWINDSWESCRTRLSLLQCCLWQDQRLSVQQTVQTWVNTPDSLLSNSVMHFPVEPGSLDYHSKAPEFWPFLVHVYVNVSTISTGSPFIMSD